MRGRCSRSPHALVCVASASAPALVSALRTAAAALHTLHAAGAGEPRRRHGDGAVYLGYYLPVPVPVA